MVNLIAVNFYWRPVYIAANKKILRRIQILLRCWISISLANLSEILFQIDF